ncbi:hypothetical protein AAC387_Pa05g3678 [Persea americana]
MVRGLLELEEDLGHLQFFFAKNAFCLLLVCYLCRRRHFQSMNKEEEELKKKKRRRRRKNMFGRKRWEMDGEDCCLQQGLLM